jgi:hypothetical protein
VYTASLLLYCLFFLSPFPSRLALAILVVSCARAALPACAMAPS